MSSLTKSLVQLIFVTLIFAMLMFGVSSVSAQDRCLPSNFCDRDGDTFFKNHKRCDVCGGPTDCDDGFYDPDNDCGGGGGEPNLEPCPMGVVCIADVGKTYRDNTVAKQFVDLEGGNYTKIESNDFDKILQALPEGDEAQGLCDAYDVLVFNWNSPRIKNLNWQRLLDYMECGGGIIFEDPKNVRALAAGVSTFEVTVHVNDEFPLLITLEPVPVLTLGPFFSQQSESFTLPFINKHIIFDSDSSNSLSGLESFLSLENEDVVGLYGEFGLGRIVLTGPDNNFHGSLNGTPDVYPEAEGRHNHYKLFFNEIYWLLEP